jgi:hypothetical protein
MPKKNPAQTNLRYEVITQEDPETGDLIIPIPPQVLLQLGWKEGDEIKFDVGQDGKIYIKKL